MENNYQNHYEKMPVIRIAPVYDGKIYVIPHNKHQIFDLPWMKQVNCHPNLKSTKQAQLLIRQETPAFNIKEHPRFSVKYASPGNKDEKVYLYILPLSEENEINFENGKFIVSDEIEENAHLYSEYLQKESGLLGMAAELWNDYL